MSQPLTPEECLQLADTFDDTPEMTISSHLLQRGLCDAYLTGVPAHYQAAVVQDWNMSGEPTVYGNDPVAIWALVKTVPDWFCVNVAAELAEPLGKLMERETGNRIRYLGDVYFTLSQPVRSFAAAGVQLMTLADIPLLEAAPAEVRTGAFGNLSVLLTEGFLACAIENGQVVAIAETYARTAKYAEIGVSTLAAYRRRGYSTAAAALVAGKIQNSGLTPVWSTGEDNFASRRVAEKLGFREVSRRVYIIPERKKAVCLSL